MIELTTSSLRQQQHPLIHRLANCIEGVWHRYLEIEPYELPEELGYIKGRLEGEKLAIENRCYQSQQFRKMHLELAKVGKSLDILHCVMFPRSNYALPMFGTDIVAGRGQVSAAVVDLSPLNSEKTLPSAYSSQLQSLQKYPFSQPRETPNWGDIFSEFCLFIRPGNAEEEEQFLKIVESYLIIHCEYASRQNPVSTEAEIQIKAAQRYYCTQQQRNDKTRRVLEKAFGVEWADYYINNLLFDYID
ncbi:MAG: phycocyanobilin:ferredoxin oxidoreductase [Microcoleaceae cyanobacterium]